MVTIIDGHQGFTDIVNSLPLIDYYLSLGYKNVRLRCNGPASPIVDYYSRNKSRGDDGNNTVKVITHGFGDLSGAFRHDIGLGDSHFVKLFYTSYGIPYEVRVDCFNLDRDAELEESTYQNFVEEHGSKYNLSHFDPNPYSATAPIRFISKDTKSINLNGITNNPFAFIKVLENAEEIHLIDSVWASVVYLLDAKYKLFHNKTIYLYPFSQDNRHGGNIWHKDQTRLEPYHLEHWKIIR